MQYFAVFFMISPGDPIVNIRTAEQFPQSTAKRSTRRTTNCFYVGKTTAPDW